MKSIFVETNRSLVNYRRPQQARQQGGQGPAGQRPANKEALQPANIPVAKSTSLILFLFST